MQERTVTSFEFKARDEAEPLALSFDLIKVTQVEHRRHDRERWYPKGYYPPDREREVVATFSRGKLAKLIADGAEWLSYVADGAEWLSYVAEEES